ncbi:ATP-binding cassette domain-containing protein [Acholeplasma granularum]|uniref:ATP-binding cassette domain-containing protein n=1 Tax=Acholeplasma granularum TaxID=264635 RepID=UPI0004B8A34C|nr:ATP-binding cassette domain-containing protein [Acholeplasma granularum]
MIELKNLSKHYKSKNNIVRALEDISLRIDQGEIFGIIGKSGVGKSTLLKILSLQILPDSGSYTLFGSNVTSLSHKSLNELIKETSYIYQNFSLLYNLNVLDNIALPLKLRGVSKDERKNKALKMLKYVGLESKANDYPITLSGGEAQRISIARALITNPKLLFLDEPTSALDEETAFEILTLIKKIHKEFKPTIILVSHQLNVIKYLCNRVLLIEDNKVKRIGKIVNTDNLSLGYDGIWSDNL